MISRFNYSNVQIRRITRKFIARYGAQDTRKLTCGLSIALETTKQRIAGNLRALKYNDHTISITTIVPHHCSKAS